MPIVVQAEFLPPSLIPGLDLVGRRGSPEGTSKNRFRFNAGKTDGVWSWGYFVLYKRSPWAAEVF